MEGDSLEFGLVAQDGFCEELLSFLELKNAFFDGVLDDETSNSHRSGLSDAVHAVNGLCFNGRRPPRVEDEDVVGLSQIESKSTSLHGDEEDAGLGVGLEVLDGDLTLSLSHGTIEAHKSKIVFLEGCLQQVQHAGPLREDNDLLHASIGGIVGGGAFAEANKAIQKSIDLGGGSGSRGLPSSRDDLVAVDSGSCSQDSALNGGGGGCSGCGSSSNLEELGVLGINSGGSARVGIRDWLQFIQGHFLGADGASEAER